MEGRMNHTILVLEDEQSDFTMLLRLIAGEDTVKQFINEPALSDIKLEINEQRTVYNHLKNIISEKDNVYLKWVRTLNKVNTIIEEEKNIILAFIDMKLADGDSLEIFEKLMEKEIPTLITSSQLDNYWKKLHQVANGRYFELLTKNAITEALKKSSYELDSLSKSVAGLIYLHPRYFTQNKLRKLLGDSVFGEEIIANELASYFYPYLNDVPKADEYNQEKLENLPTYEHELFEHLRINTLCKFLINLAVFDEVSDLKAVIMHNPENEIEKVLPENCEEYLFNQPVNYEKFKEQHTKFRLSLEAALGKDGTVYTIRMLLEDLLSNEKIDKKYRSYLKVRFVLFLLRDIDNIADFWDLIKLEPKQLISVVFSGEGEKKKYFKAIPNLVFTRDWGFAAHNKVFLSNMNKSARKRESAIAEFLFRYHPLFKELFDIECSLKLMGNEEETVEGGDVLLATPKTILIGFSDRTRFGAIKKFARIAFMKIDTLTTIIATTAPLLHPKSMHLDTFIGYLNDEAVMLDEKTFSKKDQQPSFIFRRSKSGIPGEQPLDDNDATSGSPKIYVQSYLGTFVECLKECLDPKPKHDWNPILINEPVEQYDDALNVFSIAPNKVFIYERSHRTIRKLVDNYGWETFKFEWLKNKNGEIAKLDNKCKKKLNQIMKDKNRKVLFLVDGDELALARGGPHCMTFPISREKS